MHELINTAIPLLVLALTGAIAIWILAVCFPVFALTLALFLYTAPTFGMLPRFDGRPFLVVVLLAMYFSRRPVLRLPSSAQRRLTILVASVATLIAAGIVSLLWSSSPQKTFASIVALTILAASIWILPRRLKSGQLLQATVATASVIVIPSLVLGLAGAPKAWRGGRLAGLLLNPNALAIFGLILGVCALLITRRRAAIPLFLLAAVTIVLTASRGAGLSLITALAVFLWLKFRHAWQRIALISFTVLLTWGIMSSSYFVDMSDNPTSILRQNNSRDNFNQIALESIAQAWPWGTGLGTASEAAVNILFKVLAEFGPFGVVLLISLLLMLFAAVRKRTIGLVILVVGISGNIFEGWLISAGNTFTILFFLLLVIAAVAPRTTSRPRTHHEFSRRID